MVAVLVATSASGCGPNRAKIAADHAHAVAEAEHQRQLTLFRTAEGEVTHDFLDPKSTQFRNERLVGDYVCGELNAKNVYGAYTGFHPYYWSSKYALIVNVASSPESLATMCAKRQMEILKTGRPEFSHAAECSGITDGMLFYGPYKKACKVD